MPNAARRERRRRRVRAWTGLMLAAAITAIGLAGCGGGGRPDTETRIDYTDIPRLKKALDLFKMDCGRYPNAVEGLKALVEQPTGGDVAGKWKGPYVEDEKDILDPWKRAYKYSYEKKKDRRDQTKDRHVINIWSVGRDGQDGTDDDYPTAAARGK